MEKALAELIRAGALTPKALAKAPLPRLYRLIRSSGYFRQKSRRLKDFAAHLVRRWSGRMDRFLDRPTVEAREELLSLSGIGPETADSILLYAGRHPIFVVDAYTRRMAERFGLEKHAVYREVQALFMREFPPSAYEYREYHALIVELGKRFCRARPLCAGCPLKAGCRTGRAGRRS